MTFRIDDQGDKTIKVLIDRSVRSDALIAEHGFTFAQGELLGKAFKYLKPHTEVRPRRDDWKQAEIEKIPVVVDLIRAGRVKAFTTDELDIEEFRIQKIPARESTDLFSGCNFETLPPPLDRSKWGLSIEQMLCKAELIAFCESFFLSSSEQRIETFKEGMRKNPRFKLSLFEEQCLRRTHIFKGICKGISPTHYPDAFNLWTAEEHGLDIFLVHDKKFQNVIARQKICLRCKVMRPSELLAGMEIS